MDMENVRCCVSDDLSDGPQIVQLAKVYLWDDQKRRQHLCNEDVDAEIYKTEPEQDAGSQTPLWSGGQRCLRRKRSLKFGLELSDWDFGGYVAPPAVRDILCRNTQLFSRLE
jgi:hypothetical protein